MSTARISFIEHLNKEFKNTETQKSAIETSKENLERKYANRAFDNFPLLLPSGDMAQFKEEYKSLFLKINSHKETASTVVLTDPEEQKDICVWEQKIIQVGIDVLLDENEKIKPELIKLFTWEEFEGQLNTWELLCAFVGALNHQILKLAIEDQLKTLNNFLTFLPPSHPKIIKLTAEAISYNPVKLATICTYINDHYRMWVNEKLSIHRKVLDDSNKQSNLIKFDNIHEWIQKNQSPLIAFGLAALTAVAIQAGKQKMPDIEQIKSQFEFAQVFFNKAKQWGIIPESKNTPIQRPGKT